MATMIELAKQGIEYMYRPCWENGAFIKIALLENGQLPVQAPLYDNNMPNSDLCHIGSFVEYNDFKPIIRV